MTILSDQRHIYINRQSYREAVDVGNKVISQNNKQKISNIVILQRLLFIKLASQCKTERNIEVNTGNYSVRSRNLRYCAKVMQTIIDKKSVCSDLSRFIADISAKHFMDTIDQRDIRTIFAISLRDIVLVRLLCNNISQSKQYIVAAKFVVTICRSELHFNDLS